MMLSNETVLTITVMSIGVFILLACLYLNYYLQEKPINNLNSFNSIPPKKPPLDVIYFICIENTKTGDLYEEFITMPINNVCEDSIISSINYYKDKFIMNTDYKIEDLKTINIVRIN